MGKGIPRRIIKAQVLALTPPQRLQESRQWLDFTKSYLPVGHTPGTWRDLRESIEHITAEAADLFDGESPEQDPAYARYSEQLAGFCINMRARHEGRKPDPQNIP